MIFLLDGFQGLGTRSAQTDLRISNRSQVPNLTRMKQLEQQFELAVGKDSAYIVRIDGVSFHTFLKGVKKPFDSRICNAMVGTTVDLVRQFNPVCGFTLSDEITLVFPSVELECKEQKREKTHAYNGRVQKLASVTASFASARFNYHLSHPASQWESENSRLIEQMLGHRAHFDGRVVAFPNERSIADCILWRSCYDGFRNAISQISRVHFGHKLSQEKSCRMLIEALLKDGIDVFKDYELHYLFGTFVKKEQFVLDGAVNLKTGEPVTHDVYRSRIRSGSFFLSDLNAERQVEFIMSKHWDDNLGTVVTNSQTFPIAMKH
jgi:tRNA(His) guanylyltransferase